jgi:hypothetical protein
MENQNSSNHHRKADAGRKAQQAKPREFWTLDAWDRAIDWDYAHPDVAAAFLESQGITGDFGNLPAKALRGMGFTTLYETGRIIAMAESRGEGDRWRPGKGGNPFIYSRAGSEDAAASEEGICHEQGGSLPDVHKNDDG